MKITLLILSAAMALWPILYRIILVMGYTSESDLAAKKQAGQYKREGAEGFLWSLTFSLLDWKWLIGWAGWVILIILII